MIKKFEGELEFGDGSRVDGDDTEGAVHIGGVDIVEDLYPEDFNGTVTIAVADERFTGDLAVNMGWGYSEYTPMEADEITVGTHNIIEILKRFEEGQIIRLWVSDEPVNVMMRINEGEPNGETREESIVMEDEKRAPDGKQQYVDLCHEIITRIDNIDKSFPWSKSNPQWWGLMMDLEKKVYAHRETLTSE